MTFFEQSIEHGLGEQNQYVATAWKNIAAAVVSALDDNNPALTHEEKSKLEVLSFLMLHETSATIKDACGFYADEPLASKMLQVANVWHEVEIPGFAGADDEMEFYYSKALETIETIKKQCGAAYRLRSLTRDNPIHQHIYCDGQKYGNRQLKNLALAIKSPK